jgi:tRNA A37 methylthiotransferase MiaB
MGKDASCNSAINMVVASENNGVLCGAQNRPRWKVKVMQGPEKLCSFSALHIARGLNSYLFVR